MNQALLPIPGYGEQTSLPGLDIADPPRLLYRQPPLMSLVDDEPTRLRGVRSFWRALVEPIDGCYPPGPPRPHFIPGQMVLGGPEQPELAELPVLAMQLSLLPDPPLWELDPGPPPAVLRRGRLSRRRARSGTTADQQSLF